MSALRNEGDPLDDLIYRFGCAIDGFVSTDTELDEPVPTANWDGAKRNLRNHFRKVVSADRELDERLNRILSVGEPILDFTNDPNIVGPVKDLALAAASIRNDVRQWKASLRKMTVFRLALASSGMAYALSDLDPRMKVLAAQKTNLLSYYMLERAKD